MNYEEAILKINNRGKIGLNPGLKRIGKLLNLMGNPQQDMNFIHVAGTNGKGSVCSMLYSILQEAGYNTGLFISPSVEDFRERIQINNKMISKDSLCKIFELIEKHLDNSYFKDNPITEFEITTAIAFKYFEIENCDVVVLETGMGGKLDATNIIEKPLCSVITTVSIDHKNFLGDTILEIADEKLGIIKNNSKVILGPTLPNEVYPLAKNICKNLGSEYILADASTINNFDYSDLKKSKFSYMGTNMEVPLIGEHQRNNVSIVMKVIESLKDKLNVSLENISKGLKKVNHPFRINVVNEEPLIILDASHNIEGATALRNFITNNLQNRKVIGIVGMFADKDVDEVFRIMSNSFDRIIVTQANSIRALSTEKIKKIADKYNKSNFSYDNVSQALKYTLPTLSKNDALIVFGTFSIMGEAKESIKSYFK